jgi:ribosomal protein L31
VETLEKVLGLKSTLLPTTRLPVDAICINVSEASHPLFLLGGSTKFLEEETE